MRRPGWLADRWLLGWLAAGLALRAGLALLLDPGMQLRHDETVYLAAAERLRGSGVLETGALLRPPLYIAWLALLGWPADWLGLRLPLLAKLVQCGLGAATVLPVYHSALRLAGRRAARIAAGCFALDPTLVAYCHLLWPETLFGLLVAVVFDAVAGLEARRTPAVAGLGVLIGLAVLLKPVFGLFALLLAGQWLWRLGWCQAAQLVLVCGGAATLVVAPWAVRNQLRYGPSIVLENEGPYNLWIGNDPAPALAVHREWQELGDPVTRSRVGLARGLAAIGDDPGRFAARLPQRALNLWGLEFFVVRHAIAGGYGALARGELLGAFWILQLGWAALWLAAAAGLPGLWRDPSVRLWLAYAAGFTLLVAGMVATTRFRVPFALPLAVAAGAGVERALRRRLGRAEWIAVGIALALLALSASRPLFRTLACGDWTRVAELRDSEWRFFRY